RFEFNLDAAGDLPPVVVDPTKTELILLNLLLNAIKRCPDGGRIRVGSKRRSSEVIISIADNGVAIPAKLLNQIFEKFYPVGNEGGKAPATYQLGLYTTRRLVELQGGRIWADSKPGQGSQFSFSVPIREGNP
ncbi:MAG: sensor histidine kinase, partial [Anaerolineae bacterium]